MTGQDLFSLLNNMNLRKFEIHIKSKDHIDPSNAEKVTIDFKENRITIWA